MKISDTDNNPIYHGSSLIAYASFGTVILVAILVSLLGLILGYHVVVYQVTLGAIFGAFVGYTLWKAGYPVLATSIHFFGLISAALLTHVVSGTIGGTVGILYLAAVITSGGLMGWKGVKYGVPIIVLYASVGAIFADEIRLFLGFKEQYQVTEEVLLLFIFSSIPCWGVYVVMIDVSNRQAWRKAVLTNQALLIEQNQLEKARFQQSKLVELGLLASGNSSIQEVEKQCYFTFVEHVPNGAEIWGNSFSDNGLNIAHLLVLSQKVSVDYRDFVKGILQVLKNKYEREQILKEKETLAADWQREQRLAALARMAGGVAHDFNNFLMVIMALADNLSIEDNLSDTQKEGLETILLTTQHASDMTQQLLYFSKGMSLREKVVDVAHVIDVARPMFFQMIPQYIHLQIDTISSKYGVFMPANQIERIVLNLIRNAVSAMPADDQERFIQVSMHFEQSGSHPKLLDQPALVLKVVDNGKGMDVETLERAIEPYFSNSQSTGLGLSTVHGLMEYIDGALDIQSEVGQGTTITVYFPAHLLPVDELTDPNIQLSNNERRVLLIDDEPLVRQSVALFLNKLEWEVLEAGNREEALGQCTLDVSFVVCDVRLGLDTGFLVVEALREQGYQGPVLYITGFTGEYDEQLQKGERLLAKPFRFQEFKTVIEEMGFASVE